MKSHSPGIDGKERQTQSGLLTRTHQKYELIPAAVKSTALSVEWVNTTVIKKTEMMSESLQDLKSAKEGKCSVLKKTHQNCRVTQKRYHRANLQD